MRATMSPGDEACTLTYSSPGQVIGCAGPVPLVVPSTPWLEHSGMADGTPSDIGELPQRQPIHITFPRPAYGISLSSTGVLKCTGYYGRTIGYLRGVEVARADNALINAADCGEDDLTYGVRSQFPANVEIDALVVEGVDPWVFTVSGVTARALLRYTITYQSACGHAGDTMAQEYVTFGVNIRPKCGDFVRHDPAYRYSPNFTWAELNGGWGKSNPHPEWGIITTALTNGLEATRGNYNRGAIRISAGYSCPHGNAAVGGESVTTSRHMHGRAADVYSANHSWTKHEFTRLREAARLAGAVELSNWNTYRDRRLHVSW